MISFNQIYEQNILPRYGNLRSNDSELLLDNTIPHQYCISNRQDLTNQEVFTIDPEGCQDADDAFSIYYHESNLFLAIHIADPTEYINLESSLWNDIVNRTITHYPSFHQPIHLMPSEILKRSSLTVEIDGDEEIKNAISIITEIDLETYLPTNNVKLEFTKIIVNNKNRLTYQEAATKICDIFCINIGVMISEALYNQRSEKTAGTKLTEINNVSINKVEDDVSFSVNSKDVLKLKNMIGEFAIFSNSFVGEYLKANLNGMGIFRTCDATSLELDGNNLTGRELLNQIIDNGISADYLASIKSHDLVGTPVYCHFTSPIRRLADCICHYLLKSIKLKINPPWTKLQLDQLADICFSKTKKERGIQFDDSKFRMLQLFSNLCQQYLEIEIRITSYTGLFVNCIIEKFVLDNKEYDIQISYSLRIKNKTTKENIENLKNKIRITQVNPLIKFDEGTLPELDFYLKSLFV